MSTFSTILSQLQNDSSKALSTSVPPKPANEVKAGQPIRKAVPHKPITPLPDAIKRKRDDDDATIPRKDLKTNDNGFRKSSAPSEVRKIMPNNATNATKNIPQSYRGTMNGTSIPKANVSLQNAAKSSTPAAASKLPNAVAPKAKRGFASLMAKAAAAQEASKAAGPPTIRHKSADKLTKRDRQRLAQETEHTSVKHGKPHGLATTAGSSATKGANFNGFKARTNPIKSIPKVTYQGTMRAESAKVQKGHMHKKGEGQDKYGGYASWSDLDDAEDEPDSYESGSDMEEAGYDEMMEEELKSARIARQEDEAALREEERLKREKLERKKRLMALNNSAATSKNRF